MIARLLSDIIEFGIGYFGLLVLVLLALAGEIGFRIGRRSDPPGNNLIHA